MAQARSPVAETKPEDGRVSKSVRVRRYEPGTFIDLVHAVLDRAGIEYELARGFHGTPQYRVGRKVITLSALTVLANNQRKKEGRELLPIPMGATLFRFGNKKIGPSR